MVCDFYFYLYFFMFVGIIFVVFGLKKMLEYVDDLFKVVFVFVFFGGMVCYLFGYVVFCYCYIYMINV